ncbi:MAG: hypothetical protein ABUL71_03085, partial [Gemmatimonadota bacterium]
AGCSWSNSLYEARRLSGYAITAEREKRPGEAQSWWSQVIPKADSAYARAPRGPRGAEALWLAGHAAARINNCVDAIPRLEGALSAGPDAPWRQDVLFELALCEEPRGGPTALSLYTTLIASARDPAVIRRARLGLGHAQLTRGDWAGVLATLAGEDTLPARLDRAMAQAQLGNGEQALAELARPLAASDTSVRWLPYVETLAARQSDATDSLVDRLMTFNNVPVETRSAWLLAAARGALHFDAAAADRRLRRLVVRPAGASTADGRLLQQQLRLTRANSIAALRIAVDSATQGILSDDGMVARTVGELVRMARMLVARNDAIAPGSVNGDLAMFGLAEFARDSLDAPALGAWFHARLEQQWRASPYVAKALIARAPLEPDSSDVLLARLRRLDTNPYVAAANGDVAARVRLPQLEDSLGKFVARMWTSRPGSQ